MSLILSECRFPTRSLFSPAMEPFQGPAVYAHNNAVFTPADFESVRRLGDSRKRTDRHATGQKGTGFNAVYHWTDVPSFVSGEDVVFFDPHKVLGFRKLGFWTVGWVVQHWLALGT